MREGGRTPEERAAFGRSARALVPRSVHGEWQPSPNRTDPLEILALQETTRVPVLVPLRHERMAVSAFTFFRGAAAVMASDLASDPHSHLDVQLCGDAHLSNFGGYHSPERELVFDCNDFDETLPGPFEWDLKRLAASFEIAGRDRDFPPEARQQLVATVAAEYRLAMAELATTRNLDIWYRHVDMNFIRSRWGGGATRDMLARFEDAAAKAETKNSLKAAAKLTYLKAGIPRFRSDPPVLVPMIEVEEDPAISNPMHEIEDGLLHYQETLAGHLQHLLSQYVFTDLARKVVGVGSVGTRCWIALFIGRDDEDPLILQIKQAEASVLEPFLGASAYDHHGQRVVEGQRLMQSSSDIFLGWDRVTGEDGVRRDFYVRQLWDAKLTAPVEEMTVEGLLIYAQICGYTLALGHARSGDAIAISSYLGKSNRFDAAMVCFASTYADQNERDYEAFTAAIRAGTIDAAPAP